MALSSLSKLQLVRALLLLLILLDVAGSTILLLRLGSGEELKETLIDQVSLGPEVTRIQTILYLNIWTRSEFKALIVIRKCVKSLWSESIMNS